MTEYTLSWNTHEMKVIRYSNPEQAKLQGITNYEVIEADSFREAKEQYLDKYRNHNNEQE